MKLSKPILAAVIGALAVIAAAIITPILASSVFRRLGGYRAPAHDAQDLMQRSPPGSGSTARYDSGLCCHRGVG